MKCPVCKGERRVWFIDQLIPCYVCKGKGKLEVSESRLEEYFSDYRGRAEKVDNNS